MELNAAWTMTINVEIGSPLVLGPSLVGVTSVIPITGGTVEGPKWRGRVLSGGADWNTVIRDDLTEFWARYNLMTNDGVLISVTNEGITRSDFSLSLVKTRTTFLVDGRSCHGQLLYGVHVGTLNVSQIAQGRVCIGVYRLL